MSPALDSLAPAREATTATLDAPSPKQAPMLAAEAPALPLPQALSPALAGAAAPVAAAAAAAVVVEHLSGEALRELEGWAAPLALLGGAASPFLGARVSAAGCIELASPSASFWPRVRMGLSLAGRLLMHVGGQDAWQANSWLVGDSPLFALGVGEAFSTIAHVEHHRPGASAAAAAAAAATLGSAIAGDYAPDSRVLVVWLDPARLGEEEGGDVPPASFGLTLAGGSGGDNNTTIPLFHGTVLVLTGGGADFPLYTVGPISAPARATDTSAHEGRPSASLLELRAYISAGVVRLCDEVGDVAVRKQGADSCCACCRDGGRSARGRVLSPLRPRHTRRNTRTRIRSRRPPLAHFADNGARDRPYTPRDKKPHENSDALFARRRRYYSTPAFALPLFPLPPPLPFLLRFPFTLPFSMPPVGGPFDGGRRAGPATVAERVRLWARRTPTVRARPRRRPHSPSSLSL